MKMSKSINSSNEQIQWIIYEIANIINHNVI